VRLLHLLQFGLDPHNALGDQATVAFDLAFARAAEKAEAAALPFQVSPAAHQARALIVQMRQFHLQAPFPRGGALAEDFQDHGGAVEHLAVPGLLQIALLHGRQMGVDDDDVGLMRLGQHGDLFHLAASQQGRRHRPRQRRDLGFHHGQMNRGGQPDRFAQARLCIPQSALTALTVLRLDMDDEGAATQT
jgi:hypothetical protein